MFIRFNGVNYFIIPDEKTPLEIYNELFTRMNKPFLSHKEKRKILAEITKQIDSL
jgi:SpoVK/Ycf46/Vps4 family AAA+-type ATPase